MENESYIENIRIAYNCFYDYDDFLNKKEIYVSSFKLDGSEINYWKKHRNTYRLKLKLTPMTGNNFDFPIKSYFGEIDDWVLIKYLAILEYKLAPIIYSFYDKGEKYGISDSTLVKLDNKILKSLFCIEGSQKIPIIKYVQDYEKKLKLEQLNEIVKTYFEQIEMEIKEENENKRYRDQKRSRYRNYDSYDNIYYNDQLDMDQQGPEFWDSL